MSDVHKAFNSLYTGKGDYGNTETIGGWRRKNSSMVNSYGEVDELNSHVGLLNSLLEDSECPTHVQAELLQIQHWLFDLGTDLSSDVRNPNYRLKEEPIKELEKLIDSYTEKVKPINFFVLPGGSIPSAQAHVCRTVTRRAERAMYNTDARPASYAGFKFINRLSDYFFALARFLNEFYQYDEIKYDNDEKVYKSKRS